MKASIAAQFTLVRPFFDFFFRDMTDRSGYTKLS
jgi:hypothetical protein